MKTQVVHLDQHDDIVSIRDRMAWAKSPRILLVWPRRGRVGIRPLDLTLLRRHAESLGAELGLVTRDGQIRSAAREEGISYFSNQTQAQKKDWREKQSARPMRRFPRVDLRAARAQLPGPELFTFTADPVRRVAVFVAGVLAVLVVMLVFIPSAEIQLTPPTQLQSLTISVSADPQTQNVQLSGVVPQRKLQLVLEGSDSALATGKAIIADQSASGVVVLMNLTEKVITVPAGTVLLTSATPAVVFESVVDVVVPAGKGKTITVAIRAKTAGLIGNVLPGAITRFESPLGLSLAVTNPAATKGGSENELSTPTASDRDQLRKRLLAGLEQQARARFWEQVSSGDVLLPASFSLAHIQDETGSPAAGQTGKKLSLTMRAEYTIAYATFADLHLLAERVLDASLPAGTLALPGQIALESLSTPSADGQGSSRWLMRVTRSVRPYIDPGQIISLAAGKAAGRAGSLLQDTYGLAQAPQIRIRPIWWPWLPFLPIRISVTG